MNRIVRSDFEFDTSPPASPPPPGVNEIHTGRGGATIVTRRSARINVCKCNPDYGASRRETARRQ